MATIIKPKSTLSILDIHQYSANENLRAAQNKLLSNKLIELAIHQTYVHYSPIIFMKIYFKKSTPQQE